MGNPRHIVEGGQPVGVVVMPVGDDDGGHRNIGHRGNGRPKRTALRRA